MDLIGLGFPKLKRRKLERISCFLEMHLLIIFFLWINFRLDHHTISCIFNIQNLNAVIGLPSHMARTLFEMKICLVQDFSQLVLSLAFPRIFFPINYLLKYFQKGNMKGMCTFSKQICFKIKMNRNTFFKYLLCYNLYANSFSFLLANSIGNSCSYILIMFWVWLHSYMQWCKSDSIL